MLHRLRAGLSAAAILASSSFLAAPVYSDGLAGPYLAAIQASYQNDYRTAARFFAQAVSQDQSNTYLLQNAVMNNVIAGSFDEAVPLAERLSGLDADRQIAGLVLVANAIEMEDFDGAMALLNEASFNFNPLLSGLLKGWVAAGQEDMASAQEHLDALADQTSFGPLGQYHKALVLALAGNFDAAAEIFAGENGEPLRVNRASIVAHAQILVQLDQRDEAVDTIDAAGGRGDRTLLSLRERILAGEDVLFDQVSNAKEGAAEVFLTLATALSREEAEIFALLYARLSQHIRPDYVEALLLSADIFDVQEQFELATMDYAKIPETSAAYRDAEIGMASALTSSGEVDRAIDTLRALAEKFPEDEFIHVSLGDTFRREERYLEAAESYTRALELKPATEPSDWRNYYVRGISYERLDLWDQAEADFRKSLELAPEQPLVLNYLGYSLVEKNMKIDEARDMIERAVAGDPDNGYITDSLGWVLYKIGKFEEAVPHMERAAELLPSDPVINDHLGDVLWMVGRKTEATFQWKRALSFEPDEEANPDRIRRKLEVGLDVVLNEEKENSN